jgi:hypothetical protein
MCEICLSLVAERRFYEEEALYSICECCFTLPLICLCGRSCDCVQNWVLNPSDPCKFSLAFVVDIAPRGDWRHRVKLRETNLVVCCWFEHVGYLVPGTTFIPIKSYEDSDYLFAWTCLGIFWTRHRARYSISHSLCEYYLSIWKFFSDVCLGFCAIQA